MPPSTAESPETLYPAEAPARSRWILTRRGERKTVDPAAPIPAFVEDERTESGSVAPVATLFLANRECPWRCLMCDLWKHTTPDSVAAGVIPAQIRGALASLPSVSRVKLYNAGSFFDGRAIPPADLPAIAGLVSHCERVIVESHPSLVTRSEVKRFRDRLPGRLEVAMGLETVHPVALPLLNKGMTLDGFRTAADGLASSGVALRAFVLLGLPFVPPSEATEWAVRSVAFAFDAGATAVTIIPTRTGNGAMEELERSGVFERPTLALLEEAAAIGVSLGRGRVFADLWDLESLAACPACFRERRGRLAVMNLEQCVTPAVECEDCEAGS